MLDKLEQRKASIRAKVKHPFRVIKRQFGHVKVRYRGGVVVPPEFFGIFTAFDSDDFAAGRVPKGQWKLLEPADYIGLAPQVVDRTIALIEAARERD